MAYVLRRAVESVHALSPDRVPSRPHPHALRHSKAMHMLEDGVNIVYIRDFLGHESVTTTECYARASAKARRKTLESAESRLVSRSPYFFAVSIMQKRGGAYPRQQKASGGIHTNDAILHPSD